MSRPLDQELAQIKHLLLAMAGYAERAARQAVQAFLERNDELAQAVIDDDRILDRFEMELDDQSINVMALQGPVASDLRHVAATMKINLNLERVGDEATKIARHVLKLNRTPPLPGPIAIPRLAEAALDMLQATLDAWVRGDPKSAEEMIAHDKAIDTLNRQLHEEITELMLADPANIRCGLHLMVICKSLERIADHGKNIAEVVVFLHAARDIRHPAHQKIILPFLLPQKTPRL